MIHPTWQYPDPHLTRRGIKDSLYRRPDEFLLHQTLRERQLRPLGRPLWRHCLTK